MKEKRTKKEARWSHIELQKGIELKKHLKVFYTFREKNERRNMEEIVNINGTDISIKEYKGQRVVTFSDIDRVHNRPEGTAKRNFNANKNHFLEGEDYYRVSSDEIRTNGIFTVSENDHRDKALITEEGYLMLVKSFTDDLAWEVQRKLVNGYFKAKTEVDERLSPQTQLLMSLAKSIADKELADIERDRKIKELQAVAEKAVETTEAIKEAIKPVTEDWRATMVEKVQRITKRSDKPYREMWDEMYKVLESKAGCDLGKRVRNLQSRMADRGCKRTDINNVNKISVIENDKKLREIFAKIVSDYEVHYCS